MQEPGERAELEPELTSEALGWSPSFQDVQRYSSFTLGLFICIFSLHGQSSWRFINFIILKELTFALCIIFHVLFPHFLFERVLFHVLSSHFHVLFSHFLFERVPLFIVSLALCLTS